MIYSAFKERLETSLANQGLSIDALATKPCFNQLGSRMQGQIHNALYAAQDPAWDVTSPGTRLSHVSNALKKGWTPSHLLFCVADRAAREAEEEARAAAEKAASAPVAPNGTVNTAALTGALANTIEAVGVAVDRLGRMAAPFKTEAQGENIPKETADDAKTFVDPSSVVDARLKGAFAAANYAATGGHAFAVQMLLKELEKFADLRLATALVEGARAAEKRLAAELVQAELQACQRLQAALVAAENVVAGRIASAVGEAEAAAEQRLAAVQREKEDLERQLVDERRANEHKDQVMREGTAVPDQG